MVTELPNAAPNSIIAYKNPHMFGDVITHVGIMQTDNTVISKWSWGPLLHHAIWDVPDYYGDEITFYQSISSEVARELYQKYKYANVK